MEAYALEALVSTPEFGAQSSPYKIFNDNNFSYHFQTSKRNSMLTDRN